MKNQKKLYSEIEVLESDVECSEEIIEESTAKSENDSCSEIIEIVFNVKEEATVEDNESSKFGKFLRYKTRTKDSSVFRSF